MNCNELVELVTDYLEGRLPEAELRRFEAHLEECDACVTYIAQIRASVSLLGTLREDTLLPGAADALLAEFRNWKLNRS